MEPKILFEDESIIVVDKPSGLVIHNGNKSVAFWLAQRNPAITHEPWPDPTRAGVVHRLDRETSGVLVLAKTVGVLDKLQQAFRNRQIKKVYWTLVFGHPDPEQGRVDVPIGRHPTRKTPMAVIPINVMSRGTVREATTVYQIIKKFDKASLIEATLHTGRTHQIRLHLKYLGHPILGDNVYGTKPSKNFSESLRIGRLMLHSKQLGFPHPKTGNWREFESTIPADFQEVIEELNGKSMG